MGVRATEEKTTYEKLADLVGEAATDKPLRDVFKEGTWEQKLAELHGRGFTDEEIEALAEGARAFVTDEQSQDLGYWLW